MLVPSPLKTKIDVCKVGLRTIILRYNVMKKHEWKLLRQSCLPIVCSALSLGCPALAERDTLLGTQPIFIEL